MSINLTDELLAKTKKGKIASAKQVFLEGDQENLQQIGEKTHQLEDAIKDITVSGGASTANAVSYNNEASGMTAVTAQGAIDELAAKNKTQDATIGTKAEKSEVATELDKKFNKENIAHEFGDSKDKVVSQFALPFREIESPEFIKVIVDAGNHFLFGIQLDGSIEWGKGIPAPIRTKLQEIINQCQQDKTDILEAINTAKEELSASLQAYQQTTDASIASLQEGKVDKEEGKSLIEDEVKECFRVIENEEFLKAIVDSDDKVLFGFYRATGEPYYPLNEMYHVIQNEEYFAAWVTTDDKVVLGLRRDGEIIGEIHAVNALKQVIAQLQSDLASLQEKVGTIDTNLKALLDVFSLQENPEYLAVEKDADGMVLSTTNPDGSHYAFNMKSETIPTEFGHIEDPEGRMEITTDAEEKVMSYRDSSGKKHEHDMQVTNLDVSNINLQGNSVNDIGNALKENDFKLDTPSDFSKDSYIELPIPRIAAQVRLYAPKLPTTKQDDIEAEIEYNDKDGNYFRKPIILNAQGSSSMNYYVKNMAIDINDDSKIKFGDFPSQDSFHLKKYYIDVFRGQCIVGYWLMEQVYQTRPVGKRYPYEVLSKAYSPYTGNGKAEDDFYTGSKCHPDGFPIVITWVNSDTKEEKNMGIYAWNLKKSKEVYHANKKTPENIILDGVIDNVTLFGGTIDWTQFEIRNPKSLIDVDGNKYDGDNPKELSETDKNSKKVKDYLVRLSGVKAALTESNTKETFEKYFIVDSFIDYFIISQVLYNLDGFRKNWIWCTWDGEHWTPTLYDVDAVFGAHWNGTLVVSGSDNSIVLGTENVLGLDKLYATEIKERYKELRNDGVFTTKNIANLLEEWLDRTGYANIEKELSLYTDIPSYRNPQLNDGWEIVGTTSNPDDYDNEKTYSKGNICIYFGYRYQATKEVTGVPPLKSFYEHEPIYCGFYNSVKRVSAWLDNRIAFLDKTYEYNNV
nr:MAG TPA: CotH kinase protein [Crassvirales sp.]